jgi:hypothetical protein
VFGSSAPRDEALSGFIVDGLSYGVTVNVTEFDLG